MTITPEQRAREALDRHFVAGAAEIPLVDAIAAAIREAEDAALERAAEAVKAGLEGSFDEHDLFLAATDRIRSLKHKD